MTLEDTTELSVFDHAAAYEEGESVVYRASSLGRCIGALVRARLGVTGSPPPPKFRELFDEGHAFEQRVIHAGLGIDWVALDGHKLAKYGKVVQDEQGGGEQVETEIRFGRYIIRCHPDAIAANVAGMQDGEGAAERAVVEAKFFGPDLFYKTIKQIGDAERAGKNPALGLGMAYAYQVAIEMHSTGLPLLWVQGLKDRDGELEIGEVFTMEVAEPPFTLAEIKARVYEVEGWVARGEMPPCPVPLDYPCPYWDTHDVDAGLESLDDAVLATLVDSYAMLVEEKETVAEALELAKQNIWERMKGLGVEKGKCNGYQLYPVAPKQGSVSWSKAYAALAKQTGKRVDEDAFRGKVGEEYLVVKKDG